MSSMLKGKVSRRAFLHAAALAATGLAAAPWLEGCAQPTPTAAPKATTKPGEATIAPATAGPPTPVPATKAPEKVTLRWWSYFSPDDRGGLFPTIADEYQKMYPHVTIEQGHGIAAYNEKLTTAFATGDPPELFNIQHYNWMILVAENSVLDLSEWYAQSGMNDRTHPAAVAWCSLNGKPYGFSANDVFSQEWYCNAAILEKYGLKEPVTGEDFFAVGKALKDKVKFPVIASVGDSWTWIPLLISPVQAQTVGITPLLEATEKKDYNVPGLLQAVEIVERMFKEGIIPQDALGITFGNDWATFAQGDVAIMPMLTAVHASIRKSLEGVPEDKVKADMFKEAPLFVPEPKSKWAAGYGAVWSVSRNNKKVGPTLDFLTYLASPAVQRRLVEGGYGISPLPETWDAIKDPLLELSVKHLKEATPEALYLVDFLHPRVLEANGAAMRKLATGDATPKEVLEAMTAAIRAV